MWKPAIIASNYNDSLFAVHYNSKTTTLFKLYSGMDLLNFLNVENHINKGLMVKDTIDY